MAGTHGISVLALLVLAGCSPQPVKLALFGSIVETARPEVAVTDLGPGRTYKYTPGLQSLQLRLSRAGLLPPKPLLDVSAVPRR
jgi:hypothetical protein